MGYDRVDFTAVGAEQDALEGGAVADGRRLLASIQAILSQVQVPGTPRGAGRQEQYFCIVRPDFQGPLKMLEGVAAMTELKALLARAEMIATVQAPGAEPGGDGEDESKDSEPCEASRAG
jgi:hypothetical protein